MARLSVATTVIAIFAFALPIVARAQEYQLYHPKSVLRLGGGYDPRRPTEPLVNSCIDFKEEEPVDTAQTVVRGTIFSQVVTSLSQLAETVGYSATIEAHSMLASGSASFNSSTSNSFSSDSLDWVVRAPLSFGRFRMKNPKLSALGEALKQKPKTDDFISQCGPQFTAQVEKGALISLVYSARNMSSSQKAALSASVSAAYDDDAGTGGSASANYQRMMEELSKTGQVSVQTIVQGGPGSAALKKISVFTPMADVDKAIRSYIAGTTIQNSVPIAFITGDFRQFGVEANYSFSRVKDDTIVQIASAYAQVLAARNRISEDYLAVPTTPRTQYLTKLVTDNDRAKMNDRYREYSQILSDLAALGNKCIRNESDCQPPDWQSIPRTDFPAISPAPAAIELGRTCKLRGAYLNPKVGQELDEVELVFGLIDPQHLLVNVRGGTQGALLPLPRILKGDAKELVRCLQDIDLNSIDAFVILRYREKYQQPQTLRVEVEDMFGRVNQVVTSK